MPIKQLNTENSHQDAIFQNGTENIQRERQDEEFAIEIDRIENLIQIYSDELLKNTVPFWLKNTVDYQYGGFFNYLDREGNAYSTIKSVGVLGQLVWLFSTLYAEVARKKSWLQTAAHGIDFIERHCFDIDGRMFFEMTKEGKPLQKHRYLSSEVFGAIAFARFAQAAADGNRLEKAKDMFKLLLRYYYHPQILPPQYYPQNFPLKSCTMPVSIIAVGQEIRKVWQDQIVEDSITVCLRIIFDHFMKSKLEALLENVGPDGEFLDSPMGRRVDIGLAIEASGLILEEYRHRKSPELFEKGLRILDWSLEIGWDQEFDGIKRFADIKGYPCVQHEHDMKFWRVHTEAIYAALLAYHLTKEQRYLNWFERIHDYAYGHFPDTEHGDWFKYLHRDGTVSTSLKGDSMAGPFHLCRMQIKCRKLLDEMKAEYNGRNH